MDVIYLQIMICKPSGILSRSSKNKTNRKRDLIIFPEYLILTFMMFVRTIYLKKFQIVINAYDVDLFYESYILVTGLVI